MPIPHFEWKSYEVPADVGNPLRFEETLLAVAPAAASITVSIPDLSGYPKPRDKAKYLLHVAAEVEHALLVQYLYAAFSLKSYDEFSNSQQRSTVDKWSGELRSIAKQEMGHLMAAQNMLLALGLPPYLEREEFPSIKDLYPFKFQLEPLSQRSLAKYVTAEAPRDATGIDKIVDLATDTEHQKVNHVGTIYGLLGVVLSTKQEIKEGLGNPSWDKQLREVMAAAYKQQPDPDKWPRNRTLPAFCGCTGASPPRTCCRSRPRMPRVRGTRRARYHLILESPQRPPRTAPTAGSSWPTSAMSFCSASSTTTC